MFGYKRIIIGEHERGIHMRNKRFQAVLGPGVYHFVDPLGRDQVQVYDLGRVEFEHPQLDVLLEGHGAELQGHLQVVELDARQVGLVYQDGRLSGLLTPESRTAYWRGPVKVRVEVQDIAADFRLPQRLAMQLAHGPAATAIGRAALGAILFAVVPERHLGLLLVDGVIAETLGPGLHAFWRHNRELKLVPVDTRLQAMEVQGQEILTKDKVSLRVNLSATYRVVDPVRAHTGQGNFAEQLYRVLQFGLRQTVGARTLDVLLGNKGELDGEIHRCAAAKVEEYGLQVDGVGVKDLILPGDMRDILNQVVEAEKVAQANVIRRREETAATRSLLNTAKLMEDNPILLRLKELETLEKLTDKVGNLTVFGGLDGMLQEMVRIQVPAKGH
jgi:regulator of protease activity HflC (stomatin/prohibitin superfamily)